MKKRHVLGGFLTVATLWAASNAISAPFRVTLPGAGGSGGGATTAPSGGMSGDPSMSGDMKMADPKAAIDIKPTELTPQQTQFFEAKIRPIFATKCAKCHSSTEGKVKGGLLLDTRAGWMKGGDNPPAIVPGDPGRSLVIKAVSYTDADLQMPPKGEKLSAAEVADLTAWVKMGAPDPRITAGPAKLNGMNDKSKAHWAYQPVKMPEVPEVKQKGWVKNPVDSFILAKLEENGMVPQHIANRETLLRRASYDLLGLPPTPEELYKFKVDSAPNAFEKAIDRMLASPHYGERWARFWLDSARYADTTGNDGGRNEDYRYAYAWTYRDYVIKAFNDDKPYDLFLKEQIAADLLNDGDTNPDRLAALGFITVGKRFPNGNDTIDERIDTLSKATMALTVSCARCHDHKFDPIPTADYYALHGVFSSITEPAEKPLIGKPPTAAESADYQKKLAELEQKNKDIYYDTIKAKSAEFRKNAAAYIQVQLLSAHETAETVAEKRKLIADNKLDTDLIGALGRHRGNDPVFGPLAWFAECPAGEYAKNAPKLLEAIANDKSLNPLVVAAFKDVNPASLKEMKDVANVYSKMFAGLDAKTEAYIQAARSASSASFAGADDAAAKLGLTPFSNLEPASALTTDHLRTIIGGLALGNNAQDKFTFGAINALELTHPGDPGHAMIVADSNPHDSNIFIHGEQGKRGPIAPRQFLTILSGPDRKPFKIGSGRLELAEAIASKDNPLTARVAVNRIWMHHFGEGFVHTPDDMGVQSEPPTHPQLIDYLSAKFMEEGWSVKKLHKLIMLSATYQQSSDTNATFAKKDPANTMLWRANLRRLDFESIRDTLLMFTGNLDLQHIGGRSVNLTEEPYSFRRSIYGYIDRGKLPELVQEFDYPDPNRPNSKRTSTIVPQQALFLMNSPMSADVARRVISRPEFMSATSDDERVTALYRELFQRDPRGVEVQMAADFFRAHNFYDPNLGKGGKSMANKPKTDPKDMAMSMGGAKDAIKNAGEAVDRRPLTLWEQYAQALLFTNEIAYVN